MVLFVLTVFYSLLSSLCFCISSFFVSFYFLFFFFFFFFKQKTAYEISACLVGSEMCIRDSNFILLPRAADELEIPFVASGGMADARSLVAAMSLGAEGMNLSLIHI